MKLRQRVLSHLRRRLDDALPLRLVFWDGQVFDFAPAPTVALTLRTPRLLRLLLTGDMGRLAEAYVKGDIGVDGDLHDIIPIGVAMAERIGRSPLLARLGHLLGALRPRHSRGRDAAAISYHYDVSNAFYELWLDRHMVYSCAYFLTGEEDLDTAQEQKLDHLCRKLRLRPGERLLDIGCGWGGLVRWAASHYGVAALGITLSRPQAEFGRQRIAEAGLAGRAEIRYADYRDLEGAGDFDKIVSVGMYEHVGLANLPRYFDLIARNLKPGGMALNHGITSGDRDGHAQGPPGGEFIDRLVFPGGELPHLSRVIYEVAGAGLETIDVEDLRPHYPQTLVRWVERLEGSRDAAIAAAGEERYRIWRMYMTAMAYAFDCGWLSVAQVLTVKPGSHGPAARPWTRRYQYVPQAQAPLSRALDWRADRRAREAPATAPSGLPVAGDAVAHAPAVLE
ncbi:MAG: class I SAM-dependent methyltransferase [Thiohalocapsa sp.]